MKAIAERPDLKQKYDNPFVNHNFYPYSKITRVLVNSITGEIIEELHEDDSRFTKAGIEYELKEKQHDIMVKIPAFYARRNWKGEELEDSFIAEIPPDHIDKIPNWIKELGFELFDCFIREDNSIRPYILVAVFKGSMLDNKLKSLPYKDITVNKTMDQFRDIAKEKGEGWGINDFNILSALQFLYKIAFQDLNSQKVIGSGWTNKSAANKTGTTMTLGNRSGFGNTDWGIEQGYDAPDSRIVGILGVQDGEFKYWFKDKTIKPIGIERVINQHNNGVTTSDNGDFVAKVNEDNLYVGAGYKNCVTDNWNENGSTIYKLMTACFDDVPINENFNYVVSFIAEKQFQVSAWLNGIYTSLTTKIGLNILKCTYFKQIHPAGQWAFSLDNSNKNKISKLIITNGNKYKPFIENKTLVPNCRLSLPIKIGASTHSMIAKNVQSGNEVNCCLYSLGSMLGSDNSERVELQKNVFYKSILINNVLGKGIKLDNSVENLIVHDKNNFVGQVYFRLGRTDNNFPIRNIESIEQYIFYEGQLTEEELKAELSKNLKIPTNPNNYPIPNYKGKDSGQYGEYTSLNTDFPLVKSAFYEIIDSTGTYLNKIEPDDYIVGNKIQIISGKIRVKDITTPYKLRIVPSFPFQNTNGAQAPDERITGCIMVDSTGLKSWFNEPGVKIKGIENARVVEDTEDYQILSDGTVSTIENYVTGTYQTYLERIKEYNENPETVKVPLINATKVPTIDHDLLLKQINQEKLDELMVEHHLKTRSTTQPLVLAALPTQPTHEYKFTENWKHIKQGQEIQVHYFIDGVQQDQFELNTPNKDLVQINGTKVTGLLPGTAVISTDKASFCLIIEADESAHVVVPPEPKPTPEPEPKPEPIPLPDLPTRNIIIPTDFCCRIDKKTGEIYIGEGYENLLPSSLTVNIALDEKIFALTNYTTETGVNYYFETNLHFGIETASTNPIVRAYPKASNFKNIINGNNQKISCNLVGSNNFVHIYTNNPIGQNTTMNYSKLFLVKTSTFKPFVKTIMPSGKLSIITNATSETHSFVMKLKSNTKSNYAYCLGDNVSFYETVWHPNKDETGGMEIDWNNYSITVSNNYKGLLKKDNTYRNINLEQKGVTSSYFSLTNHKYHSEYIKQLLIYKGNLTEQELKTENAKKIILNTDHILKNIKEPIKENLVCWIDTRDGRNNNKTITDRSNNSNIATLSNQFLFDHTQNSGYSANSSVLKMKKPDDSISIPNATNINFSKDFTIEFGISNYLQNKDNNISLLNFVGYPVSFELAIYGNNICTRNFAGIEPAIGPYTALYTLTNDCTLIHCINDSVNKNFIIYINNKKIREHKYNSVTDIGSEHKHIKIGGTGHSAIIGEYSGNFYTLKMYDKVLNIEEIKNNYLYEKNIYRG